MRRHLLVIALLAALGAAATASAELDQSGNLFVRFSGGISPRELPRKALAPIGVRIEGTIRVPAGRKPPALRRIRVALNRGGHLNSQGLRVCRQPQIDSATPSRALSVCGPALVGTGSITAKTSFPDQPAYLLRGEILLFNSRSGGRPAILAHIYQQNPAPITRFITFHIGHKGGTFGTLITGDIPPEVNRNGYLKSISLQLQRNYVVHGERRSYLSAACSLPAGVKVAAFPFANTAMTFEDGRTLSATMTRTCRVRG